MVKRFWVLAAAVAMVFCFASSSSAATLKIGDVDFTLGGSIRYDVGYQFSDLGDQPTVLTEDSKIDFFVDDPGNSRLNLKVDYGKVSGFYEAAISSDITTRHAYISYDMGGGNGLLIGRTWSLLALHFNEQRLLNDDALFGAGNLYSGRNPQVRYTCKESDNITFNVALEDNNASTPQGLTKSYVADELTPALLANLVYTLSNTVTLIPSCLVQLYELKGSTYGAKDIDVLSWALALDGIVKADSLTLDFEAWYGQNVGMFADAFDLRPSQKTSTFGAPTANLLDTDIDDVNSFGGWAQLAIPVDQVTIYTGAGYQQAEVEGPGATYESEISTWGIFVSCKYNLTKQFYIQPEIAYFDWGNDAQKTLTGTDVTYAPGNNDLGNDLFVGIHFQFDF